MIWSSRVLTLLHVSLVLGKQCDFQWEKLHRDQAVHYGRLIEKDYRKVVNAYSV